MSRRPFVFPKYKTYDTKDGMGSPDQWKSVFNARLGLEEAKKVIGGRDPYEVLGITKNSTWEEIKKAHRAMVMKYHPDRNSDENAVFNFKKIQAAYEIIEESRGN